MLGGREDMLDWIFKETTTSKLMRGVSFESIIDEKIKELSLFFKEYESKRKNIDDLENAMENQAQLKIYEVIQDRINRTTEMEHTHLRTSELLQQEFIKSKNDRVNLLEKQKRYEKLLSDETIELTKKIDASNKLNYVNSLLKESIKKSMSDKNEILANYNNYKPVKQLN